MTEARLVVGLKAVRARAGLSLSQAAELTGVSKAMLGQIERGESSPTIATLWKLAKGFHLPLSAFLQGETGTAAPSEPVRFPGSIAMRTLFPFDPLLGSETFIVMLEPGQEHVSQGHDIGVVEDVVVTEGALEVLRGGDWVPLGVEEALRFAADAVHGYRNPTGGPARFLNVMHYPRMA